MTRPWVLAPPWARGERGEQRVPALEDPAFTFGDALMGEADQRGVP